MSSIKNCIDCKHHAVIPDPDPEDWFCDDDVAVVCSITSNPMRDLTAKYLSDRHENRAVTSSCRPYRMRTESDVPEWCPLPQDTQPDSPALLQPPRVSDSQLVAVSQTITMLDARDYPPPNGKILCGSARRFGTTVIGNFDPRAHDCWFPMPKFPDSLKGRR